MNRDGTGKDTTTSTAQSSETAETKDEGRSFVSVPSAWTVETVRQMADGKNGLVDGDWIESDDMDPDGNIQIVQLAHIGEGRFKGSPERFINRKFASEESCTLLEAGDLLISRMSDPILRSCLLPDFDVDSVMAVDIARLTPSAEWNKYFVACLFNSRPIWAQGVAWSAGSTRKRISRKNIEKIRLPKPPLDEQRKIASVLYTIDELIEQTESVVARTRRLKKGLMQDIFRQGYYEHDRETIRLGPQKTEKPKSWSVAKLGDLADYQNGYGFSKEEWSEVGRPIIRIQDLTGSAGAETNYYEGRIDERYEVYPGDLLVSWSATLGVFRWKGPEAVLNQHIFKARNIADEVDKDFLYYTLEKSLRLLRRKIHGTTMQHITRSAFENTPVVLPDKGEQEQIGELLREIDKKVAMGERYGDCLRAVKRGLMQDLLSGDVRTGGVDIGIPDEVAAYG